MSGAKEHLEGRGRRERGGKVGQLLALTRNRVCRARQANGGQLFQAG